MTVVYHGLFKTPPSASVAMDAVAFAEGKGKQVRGEVE